MAVGGGMEKMGVEIGADASGLKKDLAEAESALTKASNTAAKSADKISSSLEGSARKGGSAAKNLATQIDGLFEKSGKSASASATALSSALDRQEEAMRRVIASADPAGQMLARLAVEQEKVNKSILAGSLTDQEGAAYMAARVDQIDKVSAALRRQEEAMRAEAAMARSVANGQQMWNLYSGVSSGSGKSASDSASVFTALYEREDAAAAAAQRAAAERIAAWDSEARDREATAAMIIAEEAQIAKSAEAAAQRQQASVSSLLGTYAPLRAESQALAAHEKEVNDLRAAGSITAEDHAAVLSGLRQRQSAVNFELERQAKGAKLSSYQVQNLSYQVNDLVTQVASGTPVMQAFTQQGGQIFQIFQGSAGGIGGVAIGFASLAAVIGAGALASYQYADRQRGLETALISSGRAIGLNRQQMSDLAEVTAGRGNASIKESEEALKALTAAGITSSSSLANTAEAVRSYGELTGKGYSDALGDLSSKAKDPVAALDELAAKTHDVTEAERDYVVKAVMDGDRTAAWNAVLAKMSPSLKEASENVGALSKAGTHLGNRLSDLFTVIGKNPTNPIDSLSWSARKAAEDFGLLEKAAKSISLPEAGGSAEAKDAARSSGVRYRESVDPYNARDQLNAQLTQAKLGLTSVTKGTDEYSRAQSNIEALTAAIASYRSEGEKAAARARIQAAASGMESAAAQRYIATQSALLGLSGQVRTERERGLSVSSAELLVIAQQHEATTRQIESLHQQTQAQQNLNTAIGRGYGARTEQEINNQVAAAQKADPTMSVGRAVDLKRELSRGAEAKRTGGESSYLDNLTRQAANENTLAAARLKGADALRQAEIEIEAATQKYQNGYTPELVKAAQAQEKLAASRNQTTMDLTVQQHELDLLRLKISMVGQSEVAQEKELAVFQASYEMHQRFGAVLPKEAEQYIANAASAAKMNSELKQNQAALDELASFGDQAFSRIGSAMTQMAMEGGDAFTSLRNVGKAMISELYQEMMKLAVMNPLKNALLGQNNPTMSSVGGMLGGLFSNFFGGSASSQLASANSGIASSPGMMEAFAGAFAAGGKIGGPGGPRSDSILAAVSNGEYMVNAAQTSKYLPLLEAINDNRLPRFADGGLVSVSAPSIPSISAPRVPSVSAGGGGGSRGGDTYQHFVIDARGADREGMAKLEQRIALLNATIERRAINAVSDSAQRGGAVAKAIRGR